MHAQPHDIASRSRPAAVAGQFYPDDPAELRDMIARFMAEAEAEAARSQGEHHPGAPKALIGPHAGYPYSGPVAAHAYLALQPLHTTIHRVVLIGPAHRVPVAGLAASSATQFETPLGPVPVDREAVDSLLELDGIIEHDAAHAPEHGLEVHLPFLIHTLGNGDSERGAGAAPGFHIVPLLFGEADAGLVARALERVWGGQETLIVVSSDLSHFHDYETAAQLDRRTADHILADEPEHIGPQDACGHLAIRGLMQQARAHRLHPRLLDLRSSGDTAGPRNEVVGYGSFIHC